MRKLSLTKLLITSAFLLFISFASKGQIDLKHLNKTWIAVKSRATKPDWIKPIDGLLLKMENNKGEVTVVGSDSIGHFSYQLDENFTIKSDNRVLGHIKHLSKDSMTLLTNEIMMTVFIPAKAMNVETTKENMHSLLTRSAWYQHMFGNTIRVDFLNSIFRSDESFKDCITHQEEDNWYYRRNEMWAISSFNNYWFLMITFNQHDYVIYQIESVNDTGIQAVICSEFGYDPVNFEPIKVLNDQDSNKLAALITSKPWTIDHLTYGGQSGPAPSLSDFDFGGEGDVSARANTMISASDWLTGKVVYRFHETGIYELKTNGQIFKKGIWTLSKDQQYIVLDHPQNPLNYIRLIQVMADELIINQVVELSTPYQGEYVTRDFKMVLK